MNGWMDGETDGMKEEVNEWVDACMRGYVDKWVNGRIR